MNREEALLKYHEEAAKYIKSGIEALERNFRKEEARFKDRICQAVIQSFSSYVNKEQLEYIHISLLRSWIDEDTFKIVLSLYDKDYFLDRHPLIKTIPCDDLFAPLKEVRRKLYQSLEYYHGRIEKYDADRMIRETAMAFFQKRAEWSRMVLRDLDCWVAEDKSLWEKRMVVKWGAFQEAGETVFLTEPGRKSQQQFLDYNEKNGIDQWDNHYVYQSWEAVSFQEITLVKKNFLFIILKNSVMEHCQWEGCMMHGASFRGAKLKQVVFAGCDLSGSDFRETVFEQVQFIQCNLSGADFTGDNIDTVQFQGSLMNDARLSRDSLSCKGLDASQLQQICMEEEPYVF